MDAHCNTVFNYFCDIYADYLPQGLKEDKPKQVYTDAISTASKLGNVGICLMQQDYFQ